MHALIVHYHEIWLKGCNRNFFVSKLRQAVKRALEGLPIDGVRYEDNRLVVSLPSAQVAREGAERLRKVPGIANIGVGQETEPTLAGIVEAGSRMMAETSFRTFRVRAKRSQKSLPFRSNDIARALGQRINDQAAAAGKAVKVDLEHAEATCFVEATPHCALIYHQKVPGVGGLPSGTGGKLVCLLSGGFDSAVAAYKIIKRGVRLVFVHFYAPPARPGEDSASIARELVRVLTPYQGSADLYLVPFGDIQREIVIGAPEDYRLLIYRRFMLRIAERVARRERALGTVTGDSIAQVASQTLQNMQAVGAAATLPIYRPVVGDDKQEILDLARRIGTYEISCEPFTDCCPRFLPKRPRIFSTTRQLDEAESHLAIEELVEQGLRLSRRETHVYHKGEVSLKREVPGSAEEQEAVNVAG